MVISSGFVASVLRWRSLATLCEPALEHRALRVNLLHGARSEPAKNTGSGGHQRRIA
jgi:hypothetical protein